MGVVYAGRHVESGQRVAIKTIATPRVESLAGLRREIFALRQLAHPGVVRMVADGIAKCGPWYAMELLEGETLRAFCDAAWCNTGGAGTTALFIARIVPVVRRLAAVLAYVHGEGIVHGDLKPENVFLRPGGQPVLVDFGLASQQRNAGSRAALSDASALAGTPAYMAPEQIAGEPVDARADLYALGCMLYELLTGAPPFDATAGGGDVLLQHLYTPPLAPSARNGSVPPELDALVLGLLAKAPRERIGQAIDVVGALARLGPAVGVPAAGPLPSFDGAQDRGGSPHGANSDRLLEGQRDAEGAAPRAMVLYVPRLAGRDTALSAVLAMADRAASGHGGMALVGGESGMGKTHLLSEIARRSGGRLRVVTATCTPIGAASRNRRAGPLHPLRPLIEAVADVCAEGGAEVARRLLSDRAHVLATYAPAAAAFARAPAGELPPAVGDEARERLFAALRETMAAFAAEQPVIVLIDDLQWADELTLDFLERLPAEWFASRPLLLLAAYRDEEAGPAIAALRRRPDVQHLALEGLDEASVGCAVADMLALAAPPAAVGRFLFRQSHGNPFYVAEYVRAAVAEGLFYRTDAATLGALQQAEPSAERLRGLALPTSLLGLVGRRLDRLGPAAREVAEVGAVLGRQFDVALLQAAAGLDDAATWAAVTELMRQHAFDAVPTGELRFVHDRIAEQAYARLNDERRRTLHRRAAEVIAGSDAVTASHWATLAHHWQYAGEPAHEQPCRVRAADQAFAAAAFAEASGHWRRAIALGESGAFGTDGGAASLAAWEGNAARAELARGDMDAAEHHARAVIRHFGRRLPTSARGWYRVLVEQFGVQLGHRLGVRRRLAPRRRGLSVDAARAAGVLTQRYYYVDNTPGQIATALLSVNLAERAGASAEVPQTYAMVAALAGVFRRHRWAEEYFAIARAAHTLDPAERAYGLTAEAVYHASLGRFGDAEAPARAAVEIVRRDCVGFARELSEVMPGHVAYYGGRLQESLAIYAEVARLARERGHAQTIAWGAFSQARCLYALGRFAEALPLLEEGRALLARRPELQSETFVYGVLASTLLHLGRADEALVRADEALERMRRAQSIGFTSDEGYAAALRVYLYCAAHAAADQRRSLLARARVLERILARMAFLMPATAPITLLRRGEHAEIDGHARRAARRYRRCLMLADSYGMQRHAALAHAALSRTAATEVERRQHYDTAVAWLRSAGCSLDVRLEPAAAW
jgi:tetratricopeptide (TPR) repeat protein